VGDLLRHPPHAPGPGPARQISNEEQKIKVAPIEIGDVDLIESTMDVTNHAYTHGLPSPNTKKESSSMKLPVGYALNLPPWPSWQW
jgi:hypothetical protein